MNNEEKILSLLETMNGRMDTMNGRMDTMDSRMEQLASDMVTVKNDVSVLKTDVAILKTDMRNVKTDIAGLTEKLDFVSDSVVRIEHEHGKKLAALFDGYQQVNDKIDRLQIQVDRQGKEIQLQVFPAARK